MTNIDTAYIDAVKCQKCWPGKRLGLKTLSCSSLNYRKHRQSESRGRQASTRQYFYKHYPLATLKVTKMIGLLFSKNWETYSLIWFGKLIDWSKNILLGRLHAYLSMPHRTVTAGVRRKSNLGMLSVRHSWWTYSNEYFTLVRYFPGEKE